MRGTSPCGHISDVARSALEDMRVLTAVLLVAYHVVGTPDSGLQLQYPHGLRFLVDLLANFRMPAFAFIAGFAFALRPTDLGSFGRLIEGKLLRLAIPGLVAAMLFALVSNSLGLRFAMPPGSLWQIVVYPYAHYWFLQAMLVLFLVIGLADALLHNRGEFVLLGAALLLPLLLVLLHLDAPAAFSIDSALRLAPCFVCGMCVYRHGRWIERHARAVTSVAAASFLASLAFMLLRHAGDPMSAPAGGLLPAMLFGMPLCLLMLLHLPHHPLAQTLGRYTFTVYLYHVFATAGMRRLLLGLGVESFVPHILLGVAGGLALPVLLHRIALLAPLTAALFLGVRRKAGPVAAPLAPELPRPQPRTVP